MFSKKRSLLALIAGITIVPLAVLLLLGWRLLEQDRILEAQQTQQNIERSADLMVAALERAISISEQQLASGNPDWPEGAVVVTFRDDRIETYPNGRVAYLPVVPPLREAPVGAFAQGETFEFAKHDSASAIEVFRELSKSSDPAIQAGALLRLGRNLAAAGRVKEALDDYAKLATLDGVAIGGVPAGVIGRYARCELLERENRSNELRDEAHRFAGDLDSGRWPLVAPVYLLYARDAAQWNGAEAPGKHRMEVFSDAIAALWERRRSLPPAGRESLSAQNVDVIWQSAEGSLRALIAMPEFVRSQWLTGASSVAEQQHVSFHFGDATNKDATSFAKRTARESNLPWTIVVSSSDPAGRRAEFALRRRLLIAGFALLVAMASTASYLIVRALNRELAVARMQSDFVAAVSHEFRTPLTTLRQFTDMLRENDADKERRRISYEAQSRATERLTKLVESLLDFGRIEAGAHRYTFERQDCSELVGHVVDDFREEMKSVRHEVTFHRNGQVPVDVDREAMTRAIRNLLDNAVKYSPDHHSVEVSLSRCDDDVRIAVRDHGIGIPKHERATIFAKFQRGEQARKRGIKGTGIGLAMVDEIVKAHHGRIEVESEPGEGSTFTIVLPRKDDA